MIESNPVGATLVTPHVRLMTVSFAVTGSPTNKQRNCIAFCGWHHGGRILCSGTFLLPFPSFLSLSLSSRKALPRKSEISERRSHIHTCNTALTCNSQKRIFWQKQHNAIPYSLPAEHHKHHVRPRSSQDCRGKQCP